jgi:hypothetical protein
MSAKNRVKGKTAFNADDPHAMQGALKHIGGSQSDNWNETLMSQTAQSLSLTRFDGFQRFSVWMEGA